MEVSYMLKLCRIRTFNINQGGVSINDTICNKRVHLNEEVVSLREVYVAR